MIITPHPYGRMANRLVLASHWIAHVEETGDSYLHLCFADYARFFEGTKGKLFLRYQSSRYKPRRFSRTFGCVNIWNTFDKRNESYWIHEEPFTSLQDETRYLLTIGWGFRTSPEVMQRNRGIIVDIFRPVSRHLDKINRCIETARHGVDHLVGVHIRHTDYKKFNGGKWFYPLSVYRSIMEGVRAQLPGSTRFLVCTDGEYDALAFRGLDVVPGTGHPVEDCYELSRCDFILGPPSTYSLWASYYGRAPLLQIQDKDQPVAIPDEYCRRS